MEVLMAEMPGGETAVAKRGMGISLALTVPLTWTRVLHSDATESWSFARSQLTLLLLLLLLLLSLLLLLLLLLLPRSPTLNHDRI